MIYNTPPPRREVLRITQQSSARSAFSLVLFVLTFAIFDPVQKTIRSVRLLDKYLGRQVWILDPAVRNF
jgi:hypothetical protein